MCQSDNNPTIKQTTAEGHQWVFNVARNTRTRRRPSAGPLKNMYTSTVILNGRQTKLRIIHKKLKLKIIQD